MRLTEGAWRLQRGPIVFCLESTDNGKGHVRNLMVADDARLTDEFQPGLLGGVEVIRGEGDAVTRNTSGELTRGERLLTAIPYYAWANRGRSEMAVWIPDSMAATPVLPPPTLASTSKVMVSNGGTNPEAIKRHQAELGVA